MKRSSITPKASEVREKSCPKLYSMPTFRGQGNEKKPAKETEERLVKKESGVLEGKFKKCS